MIVRSAWILLAALAAGVVIGGGVAALAAAPSSDPCSDYGSLPEGASSSGSLQLWPLGLRCDYHAGARLARTGFLGPSTAALWMWMVAAALLAALVLLRRDSAAARGAAGAAAVLALAGAGWQDGGFALALFACLVFGAPLTVAVDHVVRPAGTRSLRASSLAGIATAILATCTMFGVLLAPAPAIAACVVAAAGASVVLARTQRARAA